MFFYFSRNLPCLDLACPFWHLLWLYRCPSGDRSDPALPASMKWGMSQPLEFYYCHGCWWPCVQRWAFLIAICWWQWHSEIASLWPADLRQRIQPLAFESQVLTLQGSIPLKRFHLSKKVSYYHSYNFIIFVQIFDIIFYMIYLCLCMSFWHDITDSQ